MGVRVESNYFPPSKKEQKESTMIVKLDRDSTCHYCNGTNPNMWEFLDACVMITLKSRSDRTLHGIKQLHRNGLCSIGYIYYAERDSRGGRMGCWDSTSRVCKLGLQEGFQNMLSVEDDFYLDPNKTPNQCAIEIYEAMQSLPKNWNRLALGHLTFLNLPYSKSVNRSISTLTHAQLWSSNGMKWMSEHNVDQVGVNSKWDQQVDQYISMNCPYGYSLHPMNVFQDVLGSDSSNQEAFDRKRCESNERLYTFIPIFLMMIVLICIVLLCYFVYHIHMMSGVIVGLAILTIPFIVVWILALTDQF